MAEPLDSATTLELVSGVIQLDYWDTFEEQYPRAKGKTTNALFKPLGELIGGDGKIMQCEIAPGDTVRFNNDPLGDFADPDAFREATVKFRYSQETLSSNDFSEVSCSAQVDDVTLSNGDRGAIVDVAERVYQQLVPGYMRSLAMHRHLGRTARLALVNGTAKQNDKQYFAGCTAGPTNALGARVPVDTGSIAYFIPGMRLDFYTSGGTFHAGNIQVTDVNYADLSIGLAYVSSGLPARLSTGDLANVADNDEIFMSGERNKGMYSFGAYMTRPTTGDSFIGGRDRTSATYRFLNPMATREGETNRTIRLSDFDDFAIATQFSEDDEKAAVWMCDPSMHQAVRNIIGEDAFIQIPETDSRIKRFGNFGSIGLNYQHPAFGLVKIIADNFAVPNTVRVLVPETWRMLNYGWKGLKFMGGANGGANGWYRVPTSNGTGLTKVWKVDAYALVGDWCFRPWENGQILAVTPT